jgi:chromate transporter
MEILGLHPAFLIGGLLLAAILKKDKDPDKGHTVERGNAS